MPTSRLCKLSALAFASADVHASGQGDESCVNGHAYAATCHHVSLLQIDAAMTKPEKGNSKFGTAGKRNTASSSGGEEWSSPEWHGDHFEVGINTDSEAQKPLLSHNHLTAAARDLDEFARKRQSHRHTPDKRFHSRTTTATVSKQHEEDRHVSHKSARVKYKASPSWRNSLDNLASMSDGSVAVPDTNLHPSIFLNTGVAPPAWRRSLDSFLQNIDKELPNRMSVVSTKKQVLSNNVGSTDADIVKRQITNAPGRDRGQGHALQNAAEHWLTLDSVYGEQSMSKRAKEAAEWYRERVDKARSGKMSFVHGALQDPLMDEAEIPSCTHIIDFSKARLTHNNLGGHGPDEGMPTMVFSNIAHRNGQVNLEVTALSDYQPRNTANNALRSQFGIINLETGTNATLRFTFVDAESNDYVEMPPFFFSFFDLDHGRSHGSRESIDVHGFTTFSLTGTSEVQVDRRDQDDASLVSSMSGNKLDNPFMPRSLTQLQQERTVTMLFPAGLTHFDVTLREGGYAHVAGRNFLFAGPSSLVCNEQETCALFLCPSGYRRRMNAEFTVCRGGHECNDQEDLQMCCVADVSSTEPAQP